MFKFKYFFQYIFILIFFTIFKFIGYRLSTFISSYMFLFLGRFFKSKKIIYNNLSRAFPNITMSKKKEIYKNMWLNYGKILSDYMYIKNFRVDHNFSKKINIENSKILEAIKLQRKPVIFVSGHFNNFELMAMSIEKAGINLAAIYRPLNNQYLNPIMENIRKSFICKKQIKKGIAGTKEILREFKNDTSIALMIDQRVSQGVRSNFFNQKALTTTIPAQFAKKFDAKIVPVYIERDKNDNFNLKIYEPLKFSKDDTILSITNTLNYLIEKMILKNPSQWIWTHNRWK